MPAPDAYLRSLLAASLDAAAITDPAGVVLAWNAAAERLLGWPSAEAEGRRFDALALPPGSRPAWRAAAGSRHELELRDRSGAAVLVEASVGAATVDGRAVLLAVLRDLRPQRRAERVRRAEQEVVRLLAVAPSGQDPMPAVLDTACAVLGWPLGEWWRREGEVLVRRAMCGDGETAFADAGARLALSRGQGLPGLAWERDAQVELAALEVAAWPRAGEAAAAGVGAGIAVPAVVDGRLLGVLAVWGPAGAEAPAGQDAALLAGVAAALGQFEQRRAHERAQAEENLTLAALARVIRALSRSHDQAAARQAICDAALESCEAAVTYLAEPDEERGGLVITATAGGEALTQADVAPLLAFDSPSASVSAYRTGTAAFLPDIAASLPAARSHAGTVGAVSGYVQPMTRGERCLGVLGVAWTHRVAVLPPRLAALLGLLADEAAIALGRADLVSDLEAAARTDTLTGLPNLRAWEEGLSREIATAERDGRPVCVAVADLDGFKGFNDAHGHLAGDRLLREAVAAWQRSLRAGDVLARIGGDEFGLLLPACELDGAVVLADRLRRATPSGRTCSVGVAAWDRSEISSELVARADAALYEAKAQGRDRVVAR